MTTAKSPVRAHWRLPDGSTRVGPVPAGQGMRAGAEVPIWLDPAGNVVDRPISPENAAASGFTIAALVWVAGCVLLGGIYFAVRAGLDRHRCRMWAGEWARVEPYWSHRGR